MKEKMNRKTFIIVFIIIFILVLLSALIGYLYRNRNNDKVGVINVPVAKYIIVDGTLVTNEMIDTKEMSIDESTNYITNKNNIIGKCIKKNVKVDKNSAFKEDDLEECETNEN